MKHVLKNEFFSQNFGDSFHKEKKKFVVTYCHFLIFFHQDAKFHHFFKCQLQHLTPI